MSGTTFNFDEIDAPERTVRVGGHVYRCLELTRPVAATLQKLERKYADVNEDSLTSDQGAAMVIEMIAGRLEPTNGGPAVQSVLQEQWKNGALSLQRLRHLLVWTREEPDPPA